MPGRTFAFLPPSLDKREGAERRMAHLQHAHRARVSLRPLRSGRSPTGAPPRCFARTGPFFRTGRVLSHPDPGEVLRSPFRPVRKAAPLGALAATLAGH